jgi:hypothetical protein
MDSKDAVRAALKYIVDIFDGQLVGHPDVEEVWVGKKSKDWHVTVSVRFNRVRSSGANQPDVLGLSSLPSRKVVTVSNSDGLAKSVRDWPLFDAA